MRDMRVQRSCVPSVLGLVGVGWGAFACAAQGGDAAQASASEEATGSAQQVLSVTKPGRERAVFEQSHRGGHGGKGMSASRG